MVPAPEQHAVAERGAHLLDDVEGVGHGHGDLGDGDAAVGESARTTSTSCWLSGERTTATMPQSRTCRS